MAEDVEVDLGHVVVVEAVVSEEFHLEMAKIEVMLERPPDMTIQKTSEGGSAGNQEPDIRSGVYKY
jgi:hypothetical protein